MKTDIEMSTLGKNTPWYFEYSPSLLQAIPRALGRQSLKLKNYKGYDLWRLYEITYLNEKGIPKTAWGKIIVDSSSEFIVESKSLKLYIGSFTMTRFGSLKEVEDIIALDLSNILKSKVKVMLYDLETCIFPIVTPTGVLIDNEVQISNISFKEDESLLKYDSKDIVDETLRSNVLRTLCPVTSQPDHASVIIHYKGRKIDRDSLFAYLCSLRTHQGFHEQCVELIYSDIKTLLKPTKLSVLACFTRRGGIDINPMRSDENLDDPNLTVIRTFRQ